MLSTDLWMSCRSFDLLSTASPSKHDTVSLVASPIGSAPYSIGASRSMSSWQWRGGSGSSSAAWVIFSSTPQIPQRYFRLTRRISPSGGGGGNGVVIERSMPVPTNHKKKNQNQLLRNQL